MEGTYSSRRRESFSCADTRTAFVPLRKLRTPHSSSSAGGSGSGSRGGGVGHPGWLTRTGSDIQTVFLSGADAKPSEARQGQCLPPSAQKGTRDVFQGPKWDFLCAQRKRRSNRLLCLEGPLGSTISLRGSDHREGFRFLTHLLSVRPDLLDCVAHDESH